MYKSDKVINESDNKIQFPGGVSSSLKIEKHCRDVTTPLYKIIGVRGRERYGETWKLIHECVQ